jgi:hypothetical protein
MAKGEPMKNLSLLMLVCAQLLAAASTALARPGDGRLLVRWSGSGDQLAVCTVSDPNGRDQVLEIKPDPTQETTRGEHLFGSMPAGVIRVRLSLSEDKTVQAWEVPLAAELTTAVILDLNRRSLQVDPAHPDPFGNWETWSAEEITALPGSGPEAALAFDTRPARPRDAVIDGTDPLRVTRLRPRPYGLDNQATLVQVPLSAASPAVDGDNAWVSTGRPAMTFLNARVGAGMAGRSLGQLDGQTNIAGGPLGRISASGAVRGLSYKDAGPFGLAAGRLANNKLEAMETEARASFRPGGRGLARLGFYAYGDRRRHFLQEYLLDAKHGPREERADLRGTASYDFRAGPADLALGALYHRCLSETGDGVFFDVLNSYLAGPNQNQEFSPDSLYWNAQQRGSSVPPHLYNYYVRDLTTTLSLRGEGVVQVSPDSPLRFGAEIRQTTLRWYENLNPAVPSAMRWEASHLGYTLDGEQHSDAAPYAPPKPRWITLHAGQRTALGPIQAEVGLRLEQFRSDQQPVRNPADPIGSGADSSLTTADLGAKESDTNVEPSLGLYCPWAGTHFWLDMGRAQDTPPLEALYYSPNVLEHQASLAARTRIKVSGDLIFGNPALKPERQSFLQFGFFRAVGYGVELRASGHLSRVRDTWVARAFEAGVDSLNYYENRGQRRERGVHLGLTVKPQKRTQLRVLYDLAKVETNVIEPSPLYRAWLIPDGPLEGTGVRETTPLTPVWLDDGRDRGYFPSLLDRRHRIAVSLINRMEKGEDASLASLVGDFVLAATVRAASGAPYTPTYVEQDGNMIYALSPGRPVDTNHNGTLDAAEINSGRMPWSWQLDLAVRKQFPFIRGDLGVLLEVLNLTGQKNARVVYGATGEPDDDGWLDAPARAQSPTGPTNRKARGTEYAESYSDRVDNPLNYSEGRVVRFGVSFIF